MEIVLVLWLFFGGFTLGSITADKADEKSESTMVIPSIPGEPDAQSVTRKSDDNDPARCRFDKSVIYRDLTKPLRSQVDNLHTAVDDCELTGKCSERSSVLPQSWINVSPHE